VLAELDRREPDSETFIRPQRHNADIVVSFQPSQGADQEHLDCRLTLRDSLPHPDLTDVIGDGITLEDGGNGAQELYVPGRIGHARAREIEEAVWERMHFARHLREQRLGEFTIGTAASLGRARRRPAPDPLPPRLRPRCRRRRARLDAGHGRLRTRRDGGRHGGRRELGVAPRRHGGSVVRHPR
jgi:hypothetical protein